MMTTKIGELDVQYPDTTLTNLAFGSCHKNKAVTKSHQIIWPSITRIKPQTFLWLGDTIYSPSKKEPVALIETLEVEYDDLLSNSTIGYKDFLHNASLTSLTSIHGTHDDHDYGANDYGKQMPDKESRRELFLEFIRASNDELSSSISNDDNGEEKEDNNNNNEKQSSTRNNRIENIRDGLYSSIDYGTYPQKVKIILLDTRSGRDLHCPIPSLGAVRLPFRLGAPIACVTRWITAGLNLQNIFDSCRNVKMLSDEQWTWLEQQLQNNEEGGDNDSDVAVYIIGSSVQVLTTNPAVESWGHYPNERLKLLRLLNGVQKRAAVVILSGDVHHAEILDSSAGLKMNSDWEEGDGRIIEVTSSGLTHSCIEPFYGRLCGPILESFPNHRDVSKNNYYTGRNWGSIQIEWGENAQNDMNNKNESKMQINVHDVNGKQVLTTGLYPLSTFASHMTEEQLRNVVGISDGHLIPYVKKILIILFLIFMIYRRSRKALARTSKKVFSDKKKMV